jgi:vomeronasal1 receptor
MNMLLYVYITENVIAKTNVTLVGHGYSHAYCQDRHFGNANAWSSSSIILTRDLLFVVLMMWTSLYMVCLLYRHHRTAQHVHSSSLPLRHTLKTKPPTASFCLWVALCSFIAQTSL